MIHGFVNNIKTHNKGILLTGYIVDYSGTRWGPVVTSFEYCNEPRGSIKGRALLDPHSDYHCKLLTI